MTSSQPLKFKIEIKKNIYTWNMQIHRQKKNDFADFLNNKSPRKFPIETLKMLITSVVNFRLPFHFRENYLVKFNCSWCNVHKRSPSLLFITSQQKSIIALTRIKKKYQTQQKARRRTFFFLLLYHQRCIEPSYSKIHIYVCH